MLPEQTSSADRDAAQQCVLDAVELTRDGAFEEALEKFEANLSVITGGDLQNKRIAAAAFSYYGLCLAMVKRRYADGVKFCKISIKANFMDPDHRCNLGLVYLERQNRRRAIGAFEEGLRIQPTHRRINAILDRIGRRTGPVVPFLSRDNPLNVWLGRRRRGKVS